MGIATLALGLDTSTGGLEDLTLSGSAPTGVLPPGGTRTTTAGGAVKMALPNSATKVGALSSGVFAGMVALMAFVL